MRLRFGLYLILLLFFLAESVCAAEFGSTGFSAVGWSDPLNSGFPNWQFLGGNNQMMVLKRERTTTDSHDGNGSEKWRFVISKKADLFLGHSIDFPWLIEELSPTVWVKSDRPGLTLGVQVVLPRSNNPNTGRPYTFLLAGSKYSEIGNWQQLHFKDSQGKPALFKSAFQTAKLLRPEFDASIDIRDMYVRQLLLYIEGMPDSEGRPYYQTVWIDDVHVSGHAPLWSIRADGIDKLEPEYAAFQFELKKLREKGNSSPDKQNSSSSSASGVQVLNTHSNTQVQVPDSTSPHPPVPSVQRIELIGSLNNRPIGEKTPEKLIAAGFHPRFDPINFGAFLMNAVSEPVFLPHTVENEIGSAKFESSITNARRLHSDKDLNNTITSDQRLATMNPNNPYTGLPTEASFGDKTGTETNSAMPISSANDSPTESQPNAFGSFKPMEPPQIVQANIPYSESRSWNNNRNGNIVQSRYQTESGSETLYVPNGNGTATPPPSLSETRSIVRSVRIAGKTIRDRKTDGTETAFAVRAIEYRGESLAFLKNLRFNAVWLSTSPTQKLLEEANQVGIWLICPPPTSLKSLLRDHEGVGSDSYDRIPPTPIDYNCVLAWNLGENLIKADFESTELLARELKAADNRGRQNRPFVCSVDSGVVDFSRIPEMIVLAKREPLLTTLDLLDYGSWLTNYQKPIPSTPRWIAVQTQPDPRLIAQWDLFGGHREQPIIISFDQIRLLARQAIASGSHGIVLTSHTSLEEKNPETEYRVKAIALLNMELMLIEEWFAEGIVEGIINSDKPRLSAVLLRRDRMRLLVPFWNEPNSQYAFGDGAVGSASFLLPSVPETYGAQLLTPGIPEPIKSERIAGGTRIELSDASLNSLVFLTEDSADRSRIGARAELLGKTMSELAMQLTQMRLESDEKIMQLLKQASDSKTIPDLIQDGRPLVKIGEQETLLKETRRNLKLCNDLFNVSDYAHAYLQAERTMRGLRQSERKMWVEATRIESNPSLLPVSTCFQTIPFYISAFNNFRFATKGQEQLLYGDFECDLNVWAGVGWKHEQHRVRDVLAEASFLKDQVHSGTRCLELSVWSQRDPEVAVQVETPPIWIKTPSIPVKAGQLICVSGWINVPEKIAGSVDGAMISDSIGGDVLALRFDKTDGWRQFAFFRYAPSEGLFETSFLLTGIGKVWFDDISIAPVMFGNTLQDQPQTPATTPSSSPSRWGPLERLNPLQYWPNNREGQ